MSETFVCDSCGNEFPQNQLKEAFREEGKERIKERLCPSCLDLRMNEAGTVKGVVGEEKAAAVRLSDETVDVSGAERESLGTRE